MPLVSRNALDTTLALMNWGRAPSTVTSRQAVGFPRSILRSQALIQRYERGALPLPGIALQYCPPTPLPHRFRRHGIGEYPLHGRGNRSGIVWIDQDPAVRTGNDLTPKRKVRSDYWEPGSHVFEHFDWLRIHVAAQCMERNQASPGQAKQTRHLPPGEYAMIGYEIPARPAGEIVEQSGSIGTSGEVQSQAGNVTQSGHCVDHLMRPTDRSDSTQIHECRRSCVIGTRRADQQFIRDGKILNQNPFVGRKARRDGRSGRDHGLKGPAGNPFGGGHGPCRGIAQKARYPVFAQDLVGQVLMRVINHLVAEQSQQQAEGYELRIVKVNRAYSQRAQCPEGAHGPLQDLGSAPSGQDAKVDDAVAIAARSALAIGHYQYNWLG